MQQEINEIEINGTKYIRADSIKQQPTLDEDVVLVRTQSAGVFFGRQTSGQEKLEKGIIDLSNARRVWFWSGAASLSQLAVDGTKKPKECKFPIAVPKITLLGVLEVIPVTKDALASLNAVAVWKQ